MDEGLAQITQRWRETHSREVALYLSPQTVFRLRFQCQLGRYIHLILVYVPLAPTTLRILSPCIRTRLI